MHDRQLAYRGRAPEIVERRGNVGVTLLDEIENEQISFVAARTGVVGEPRNLGQDPVTESRKNGGMDFTKDLPV